MSIVTVHGPNTMYTTGAGVPKNSTPAGAQVTQSQSNGLAFACTAQGTRVGTDYVWTASGSGVVTGSPGKTGVTVTFPAGAAGVAQTITLTVSGAGTPPLANGTYVTSVTPVTGAPRDVEGQEAEAPAAEAPVTANNGFEEYDPYDHTVNEVMDEAHASTDDPEYIREILAAERQGKNRSTLVTQLEDLLATLG